MRQLPQSDHHPQAFRQVFLPSGGALGVWADPLIECATRGDWRVACTFSRPVELHDFLVILSWTGVTWNDTGVRLGRMSDLQLPSPDQQAFQAWLTDEQTIAWLAELQEIVESAVTRLQTIAVTALSLAMRPPLAIHLEDEVLRELSERDVGLELGALAGVQAICRAIQKPLGQENRDQTLGD